MKYPDLQKQKEQVLDEIEAEIERAKQIYNAEAAYKRGEITAEQLREYRIITAKYILVTK